MNNSQTYTKATGNVNLIEYVSDPIPHIWLIVKYSNKKNLIPFLSLIRINILINPVNLKVNIKIYS